MSKKKRRLAAIMFTDIVGYSSLMQKDEEYANRMRVRHREIFNRWHKKYMGEVLQYYGDGTLSIFSSTTDAVECAVAMQQSLKSDPKVPIRVGIHTGDITYSEDEVYGDGVNIAARIESVCVPGGVFLSGKAYDDIKNHARLRAKPLGYFPLKNIQQQVNIYAISNSGITVPEYEWNQARKPKPLGIPKQQGVPKSVGKKKKWVAAILAFFFGIFGAHRFYLEQRKYGIIYLSLFFLGAFIIPGFGQLVAIPAILGFIDFISFLSMSRETFDAKFNTEVMAKQEEKRQAVEAEASDPKHLLRLQFEQHFKKGIEEYREYDYKEAIEQLLKAIEIKYDVPEAHFLLARCYSMGEDAERAITHLEAAVAFGLKKPERIKTHDDLAYLRIQPGFEKFEANNYRIPAEPIPKSDFLELDEPAKPDLLEQLSQLQKQWKAGQLTDEEFQLLQKELKSK